MYRQTMSSDNETELLYAAAEEGSDDEDNQIVALSFKESKVTEAEDNEIREMRTRNLDNAFNSFIQVTSSASSNPFAKPNDIRSGSLIEQK